MLTSPRQSGAGAALEPSGLSSGTTNRQVAIPGFYRPNGLAQAGDIASFACSVSLFLRRFVSGPAGFAFGGGRRDSPSSRSPATGGGPADDGLHHRASHGSLGLEKKHPLETELGTGRRRIAWRSDRRVWLLQAADARIFRELWSRRRLLCGLYVIWPVLSQCLQMSVDVMH